MKSSSYPHHAPLAISRLSNGLIFSTTNSPNALRACSPKQIDSTYTYAFFNHLIEQGRAQPGLASTSSPSTSSSRSTSTARTSSTSANSTAASVNEKQKESSANKDPPQEKELDYEQDFDLEFDNTQQGLKKSPIPTGAIYRSLIPKLEEKDRKIRRTRSSRLPNKPISSASSLRSSVSSIFSLRTTTSAATASRKPKLSLLDLPVELIDDILANLDQKSLFQLLQVSRPISSLTIRHLYFDPKFTSTYRFAQFVTVITHNWEFANYVKVLDLSGITRATRPGTGEVLAGWRDWKLRSEPLYSTSSASTWPSTMSSSTTTASPTNPASNSISFSGSSLLITDSPAPSGSKKTIKPPASSSAAVTMKRNGSNEQFGSSAPMPTIAISKDSVAHDLARSRSRSLSESQRAAHKRSGLRLYSKLSLSSSDLLSIDANHPTQPTSAHLKSKHKPSSPFSSAGHGTTNTITTAPTNTTHSKSPPTSPAHPSHTLPPHPVQSFLLRQFSNSRDIPTGALLHVFKCCKNLLVVDLSRLQLANDYFIRAPRRKYPITAASGYIFVSDVARLHTWPQQDITPINCSEIIDLLCELRFLTTLTLKRATWLSKDLVKRFLNNAEAINFTNTMQGLDFTDSGLARDLEWAICGTPEKLKVALEPKEEADDNRPRRRILNMQ